MEDIKYKNLLQRVENLYRELINQLPAGKFKIDPLEKNYKNYLGKFKKEKNLETFRQLQESLNELVVASEIFKKLPSLSEVSYESEKVMKIDFLVNILNDKTWLVEVKSINPNFNQAKVKDKYIKAINDGRLSCDTDYDEETYHDLYSFCSKAAIYASQFEKKIKEIPQTLTKSTTLVFCTNRASFTKTELEDFVQFYKGNKCLGDALRGMEQYDSKKNNFLRNIDEFAFLDLNGDRERTINWSV